MTLFWRALSCLGLLLLPLTLLLPSSLTPVQFSSLTMMVRELTNKVFLHIHNILLHKVAYTSYRLYLRMLSIVLAPTLTAGFVQTSYEVVEKDDLNGATVCVFVNGLINQPITLGLSVIGGSATGKKTTLTFSNVVLSMFITYLFIFFCQLMKTLMLMKDTSPSLTMQTIPCASRTLSLVIM